MILNRKRKMMQAFIDAILNFFKNLFSFNQRVPTPIIEEDDNDSGTIIVDTVTNESEASPIPPIHNYQAISKGPTSQRFKEAYFDYHTYPAIEVWQNIGGGLNDSYGKDGSIEPIANSCATRLSRALNYAGDPIPKGSIGANRNYDGTTPGDNLYYIIQARKLRTYLHEAWGPPNQTLSDPRQIDLLKEHLKVDQYAIILSDGHASAVSPTYNDNYIRQYLGDMWILSV